MISGVPSSPVNCHRNCMRCRTGRREFSADGRMSCATCHSPEHGYGPPNGLAVQLGGPGLDQQGARAVPVFALRSESHSVLE